MNTWIKSSLNKKHTIEIVKNAIYRFSPFPARLLNHNEHRRVITLNLGDANNVDIMELNMIVVEIASITKNNYYGSLRTYEDGKQIRIIEIKSIRGLDVKLLNAEVILNIHYGSISTRFI